MGWGAPWGAGEAIEAAVAKIQKATARYVGRVATAMTVADEDKAQEAFRDAAMDLFPTCIELLQSSAARVRALEEELKAVDEACLAVCPCNTEQTAGEVDPELGRYVCMDEDGEPIIDTDSPAEVIARLDELWGKQQERAETAEYGLAALRKEPTNG